VISMGTGLVSATSGPGLINNYDFNPPLNTVPPGSPAVWRDKHQLFSQHPAGAQVVLCDGSVQFLNELTDRTVLWAMATRNGNETYEEP
jgi:uncharacterized protein DUF1559